MNQVGFTHEEREKKRILVGNTPLKFSLAEGISPKDGGVIEAHNRALVFRDGARLKFYEEVQVTSKEIDLKYYSYHYERPNGYFFRYERETTQGPLRKPEYQLRVILNLPHFVTPLSIWKPSSA